MADGFCTPRLTKKAANWCWWRISAERSPDYSYRHLQSGRDIRLNPGSALPSCAALRNHTIEESGTATISLIASGSVHFPDDGPLGRDRSNSPLLPAFFIAAGWYKCEIMGEGLMISKPFHLMTPAERTAARIAQNRAISEKIAESKSSLPPRRSTGDYIRVTPEERAKLGSMIRKLKSWWRLRHNGSLSPRLNSLADERQPRSASPCPKPDASHHLTKSAATVIF